MPQDGQIHPFIKTRMVAAYGRSTCGVDLPDTYCEGSQSTCILHARMSNPCLRMISGETDVTCGGPGGTRLDHDVTCSQRRRRRERSTRVPVASASRRSDSNAVVVSKHPRIDQCQRKHPCCLKIGMLLLPHANASSAEDAGTVEEMPVVPYPACSHAVQAAT